MGAAGDGLIRPPSAANAPPLARGSRLARIRLYAPFTLLLVLAVGCAWAWAVGRARLASALDAEPAAAAARGIALSLGERTVSGFPFRLRVRFASARAERGGWVVEAPGLVAQAYVFSPRHWVLVAPEGMTVQRPHAPALAVRGQGLRASVSALGTAAWRLVVEGDGVRTEESAGAPGARPFPLQSARRIELDARPATRAGGTDVLVQAEGAVATPESALWQAASGAPFDVAFSGRLQPEALVVERLAGRAGAAAVSSPGAVLRLDAAGRLAGVVPLRIVQAPTSPPARPGTPAAVAIARTAGRTVDLVLAGGKASLRAPPAGPTPAPSAAPS